MSVADILYVLGLAALARADYKRTEVLLEEAATLSRQMEDTASLAQILFCLGLVAVLHRDHEKARALYEESLKLAQKAEGKVEISRSLHLGASVALDQGDHEQAKLLCVEGLEVARQMEYKHSIVFLLRILAALACSQGQLVRSARLWGAAEKLGDSTGFSIMPSEQQYYRPYLAAARTQLDETTWAAAWAEGKAMTQEAAIEYALSEMELASSAQSEATLVSIQEGAMTRREQQVAVLLARGLTNKQLAKELEISERTVDKHVSNILRKLRFHSRSQITAWVTEQQQLPPDPN